MLRVITLSLMCFATSWGAPMVSTDKTQTYLAQFGYIEPASYDTIGTRIQSELPGESMRNAIAAFQKFAGLNSTGHLDNETVELMATPRCGVKDKLQINTLSAMRLFERYATHGSRWSHKALTYRILKYPSGMRKADVEDAILRAFLLWSQHADITFKQVEGDVDIEISFEKGEHGDGDPFDGPGGTLAHAYFPTFGGDAHFDDTETWTVGSNRGTNLFQVAAHEFGHSLGLLHSDVRSALMAPFYRGYDPDFRLSDDDIKAIQELYKPPPKVTEMNLPITIPPPLLNPELCLDPVFDTIFTSKTGDVYVFKDAHFYVLRNQKIRDSGLISQTWTGLPANIDAAFMHSSGKTYFFKGSQYWRYIGQKMDAGDFPKAISQGFPGVPNDLDAVIEWSGNKNIYFFKGSYYWRFNPFSRPSVYSSYPKHMSVWEGVPHPLDAGVSLNGVTYFFKYDQYYRFNDTAFRVSQQSPAYPRLTASWWFGCDTTDVKPVPDSGSGSNRRFDENTSLLLSILMLFLKLNHLLTRRTYH